MLHHNGFQGKAGIRKARFWTFSTSSDKKTGTEVCHTGAQYCSKERTRVLYPDKN